MALWAFGLCSRGVSGVYPTRPRCVPGVDTRIINVCRPSLAIEMCLGSVRFVRLAAQDQVLSCNKPSREAGHLQELLRGSYERHREGKPGDQPLPCGRAVLTVNRNRSRLFFITAWQLQFGPERGPEAHGVHG